MVDTSLIDKLYNAILEKRGIQLTETQSKKISLGV